jgi:S1-C subfamily serine protease
MNENTPQKTDRPITLIPTQPERRNNKPIIAVIIGVLAVLGIVALSSGITAWLVRSDLMNTRQIQLTEQPVDQGVGVVEKVSSSVVSITTQTQRSDWLGRRAIASGAGSGLIVSRDGYILTNNHVVTGASTVSIMTKDNKEYRATVVSTEPDSDLALLKVQDADNFTPAELGNSDDIKVGEDVYAVGNALGQYPNSVTRGIVSGLGRPITASGLRGSLQEFEDLIQTDAAINSGNSGGPLVNTKGQVIGINTAVAGDAQNIGFSVPINRADELIKKAQSES